VFRLELAPLLIRVMALAHQLSKGDISLSSARGASEVLSFWGVGNQKQFLLKYSICWTRS